MSTDSLLRKENILAASILATGIAVSLFLHFDPFKLVFPNTKLVLSKNQVESITASTLTNCQREQGQNRANCYKDQFKVITEKFGLATAETVLVSIQEKDDLIKSCHLAGHYIGNTSYKRAPWQFWELMETVNANLCGSGIMHGIVEGYIGDHPEIELGGAFASDVCAQSSNEYRQNQCVHVLGHMILLSTYGNFKEAAPLCETVDMQWRFHCYDGLFMEDHQKLMLQDHAIMERPQLTEEYLGGIRDKCLLQTGEAARACWTEMAEPYLHAYGYDADMVYKKCAQAPTEELAANCYMKGVVAMGTMPNFGSAEKLASLCSYYIKGSRNYRWCTNTLISANLFNSPTFMPRVVLFCSLEEENYKDACYALLAKRLKEAIPEPAVRITLCDQLPQNQRTVCRTES